MLYLNQFKYYFNKIATIKPSESILKEGWKIINNHKESSFIQQNVIKCKTLLESVEEMNPFQIFCHIFSDEIFDKIAIETNKNFRQIAEKIEDLSKYSDINRWSNVNSDMCKSFTGIILIMCLNYRDSIDDHWSNNNFLKSPISELISRHNFYLIWRFFHLADNEEAEEPIDKVKNFISEIEEKWNKIFEPGTNIALDETMMSFQGRTKYLQYAPRKPIKWGIKAFTMADSQIKYMLRFRIYKGKSEEKEYSISEEILKSITPYIENKNHILYLDSFFSSPKIFKNLKDHGINCIGMVNIKNKELPNEVHNSLSDQEIKIFTKNDEIYLIQYKDKKVLNLLSSIGDTRTITQDYYDKRAKQKKEKMKPKLIVDYIMNMRAVDVNNQLSLAYTFDNRVYKWWKGYFFTYFKYINYKFIFNL